MKLKKYYITILIIFISLIAFPQTYPIIKNIVTDNANIFSVTEKDYLTKKLTNYETKTSTQIVVFTINDLHDDSIENYANKLFNQNKLGQKEKDNGVLILFSNNDRKVRIEVGYGLEHVLTDLLCHRIIYNTMIPEFKNDNNYMGIDLATTQLISFLDDPNKADQFIKDTDTNNVPLGVKIFLAFFVLGFVGIFAFVGSYMFLTPFKRIIEIYRGLLIGKLSLIKFIYIFIISILGALISSFFVFFPIAIISVIFVDHYKIDFPINEKDIIYLIPFYTLLLIILPLVIAIYKIVIKKDKFDFSLTKTNKKYYKKTFSSSGSHSISSGSSGSSSGSSFSGGGGSSGGGGASGSW